MYLRFLSVLRAGLVLWRPERAGADKTCSTSNWTETLSRAFPRWTCHRERQLCLFLLLFCLKPARHVWKHTVFLVVSHSCTPLRLLTRTLPWFTFDRFQPCLTLTHSQPCSCLFNCLLLSLVHIHSGRLSLPLLLPSSPEKLLATRRMRRCLRVPWLSEGKEKKGGVLGALECVCCHCGAN